MIYREPVSWSRPHHNWLELGGIFPSGEPPFDPFPTVSDIIAANFCPVSVVHRLLHGVERSPTLIPEERVGEMYHYFIAYLKSSIASGRLREVSPGIVRQEFLRFGGGRSELIEIWRRYLEPWCQNRLDELNVIEQGERMFFEVTVASEYVPFVYEQRRHFYPLRGRIDEIDLERRLIIERTLAGEPDENFPPESDAKQLWLLWKILASINRSKYPEELREISFDDFDLIVETPFRSFKINKQNSRFEEEVHSAYAWIRDIAREPRSVSEAYRNKRCDLEPAVKCSFMYQYIGCRRGLLTYPRARSHMRDEFRNWYRPLLFELMWNYHLFQYKLLRLSISELEQEGLVARAQVFSLSDQSTVEVKVTRVGEIGPILAYLEDASVCELIFGTPSIGQRLGARLRESNGNKLIMQVERSHVPISNNTLILPDVTLLESKPWFLIRLIQRNVFRFEHIGRDNPDRAREDPYVQLVEGLFGSRKLVRGRSDAHS